MLNRYIRAHIAALVLGLLAAFAVVTVVDTSLVGPPAAQAVGKHCKNHSHRIGAKLVHDIPSSGGAGRVAHDRPQATPLTNSHRAGGSNPDYVIKGWATWCGKGSYAHIWKVGVKYRFPRGTQPCGLGFQGAFSTSHYWYSGGAERTVIKDCDGRIGRHVKKVDVDCDDGGVAPNPGLENACQYSFHLKGAWSQISDHTRDAAGAFYYN